MTFRFTIFKSVLSFAFHSGQYLRLVFCQAVSQCSTGKGAFTLLSLHSPPCYCVHAETGGGVAKVQIRLTQLCWPLQSDWVSRCSTASTDKKPYNNKLPPYWDWSRQHRAFKMFISSPICSTNMRNGTGGKKAQAAATWTEGVEMNQKQWANRGSEAPNSDIGLYSIYYSGFRAACAPFFFWEVWVLTCSTCSNTSQHVGKLTVRGRAW